MPGTSRSGGRNKKPTAVKLLTGTFRGDRHGKEVTVPAVWPMAPAHLTARERDLWSGLEAHCALWVAPSDWLAINGVVSLMDRILRNQDAQRETDTAGGPLAFKHIIEEANGKSIEIVEAKENPLITQEVKLWRELRAYIGLVGLSPVDRARVQKSGEPAAVANPLDRFLKRKA